VGRPAPGAAAAPTLWRDTAAPWGPWAATAAGEARPTLAGPPSASQIICLNILCIHFFGFDMGQGQGQPTLSQIFPELLVGLPWPCMGPPEAPPVAHQWHHGRQRGLVANVVRFPWPTVGRPSPRGLSSRQRSPGARRRADGRRGAGRRTAPRGGARRRGKKRAGASDRGKAGEPWGTARCCGGPGSEEDLTDRLI
jgi:hypothetical protein